MRHFLLFLLISFQFIVFGQDILTGADQTEKYLHLLKDKQVGIVGNQTSEINLVHLVDTLIAHNVSVARVFSPEHGFRGKADAGEKVKNGKDSKTGIEIVSLYGKNKKPTSEQLDGLDILIFDIQDVGARFYTYISTLHYVMEACAEKNLKLLILDRPNPNGHIVDGPTLKPAYKSFIGMHPIPVLHGMTIGEYAHMINGEQWLTDAAQCEFEVIKCVNYTHNTAYALPVSPSPNLPNMSSIYLYPSLCFFEGTEVSVGRGTVMPFQHFGHPKMKATGYDFTPKPMFGAKKPKLNGEKCIGQNLREYGFQQMRSDAQLNLSWLIEAYKEIGSKTFFKSNGFFNLLAGTNELKKQIENGTSYEDIRKSWQADLDKYKSMRVKYLLYK